jgi:hypothetical protein
VHEISTWVRLIGVMKYMTDVYLPLMRKVIVGVSSVACMVFATRNCERKKRIKG